jgi:hypothetical protein
MRNERRPGAARSRVIPIALHTKVARGGPTLARTAGTDHKSCGLRSAGGLSPQFRGKLWQIGKRRFPKAFQVASGPNQTRRDARDTSPWLWSSAERMTFKPFEPSVAESLREGADGADLNRRFRSGKGPALCH